MSTRQEFIQTTNSSFSPGPVQKNHNGALVWEVELLRNIHVPSWCPCTICLVVLNFTKVVWNHLMRIQEGALERLPHIILCVTFSSRPEPLTTMVLIRWYPSFPSTVNARKTISVPREEADIGALHESCCFGVSTLGVGPSLTTSWKEIWEDTTSLPVTLQTSGWKSHLRFPFVTRSHGSTIWWVMPSSDRWVSVYPNMENPNSQIIRSPCVVALLYISLVLSVRLIPISVNLKEVFLFRVNRDPLVHHLLSARPKTQPLLQVFLSLSWGQKETFQLRTNNEDFGQKPTHLSGVWIWLLFGVPVTCNMKHANMYIHGWANQKLVRRAERKESRRTAMSSTIRVRLHHSFNLGTHQSPAKETISVWASRTWRERIAQRQRKCQMFNSVQMPWGKFLLQSTHPSWLVSTSTSITGSYCCHFVPSLLKKLFGVWFLTLKPPSVLCHG